MTRPRLASVRKRKPPSEIWRTVRTRDGVEWPDYEVSADGRVRRRVAFRHWQAGGELRQFHKSGYPVVGLHRRGAKPRQLYVHELVCVAFHGVPANPNLVIRHLDGEKTNNHSTNHSWGTDKENGADAVAHGHIRRGRGHGRGQAKHTLEQGAEIKGLMNAGAKNFEICEYYGLSPQAVCNIRKGRTGGYIYPIPFEQAERLLKNVRRSLGRKRILRQRP